MGILTEADQEHLGRIPAEIRQSGGLLLRDGAEGGQRKPLPCSLHHWSGSRGDMVGIEGIGLGGVGAEFIRGGLPLPADSLLWNVEAITSGVFICAASHPQHWGRFRTSGEHTPILFPAIPLLVIMRGNTVARGHPPCRKTGGYVPTRPH